jgi:hypothetical protein
MPKVALVQVVYNSKRFMSRVIPAALNQTEKDIEFYAVISANDDASRVNSHDFKLPNMDGKSLVFFCL